MFLQQYKARAALCDPQKQYHHFTPVTIHRLQHVNKLVLSLIPTTPSIVISDYSVQTVRAIIPSKHKYNRI